MKVIKNKYIHFPTLHDSLQKTDRNLNDSANQNKSDFDISPSEQQKRIRFFYIINKLNSKLNETEDVQTTIDYLNASLKEIVPVKNSFFFLFDDNNNLKPASKYTLSAYTSFVNKAFANGIFDWTFETGKITVLPDITKSKSEYDTLSLAVFPLFNNNKPFGVFAVVTPLGSLSNNSYEAEIINILISIVQNKVIIARQKEELQAAYQDLQVYQSKLSNDFKYSAIGELTAGIVEDVMSPIQVVMSCTSFIEKEYSEVDKKLTGAISSQIKKIQTVVGRLTKFIGNQSTNGTVYPLLINNPINDYYEVVLSSLRYKNYECILDLDNNIPPILSQKTYIHQLLTNLFGLVLNSKVEGGGILVQTKFSNNNIVLRFIVTDRLNLYSDDPQSTKANLNVQMISNIMKRHQGDLKVSNNESGGTTILLTFPIKRRMSK